MTDHFGGPIPQADAGHSETNAIYGAVITVTILATVAVILRFVARRNLEAPILYDAVGTGETFLLVVKRSNSPLSKIHCQNGLASFALYFTTTATIKISLLLLYYRLFSPSRRFRMAVYATAVIVVAWWIAVLFADIFQCVPVQAFWDFRVNNHKTARCMDTVTFSIGTGVSNLVTDIMVLSLPLPMVWSLRTNQMQKITLTGIFLLGFL
ncbi:MAG: hypothetical protein Q9175_003530 [Cornicularia normoerica]